MGTLDRNLKCETDGAGVQDSPGYFGHIELAKPMFHIGFVTNVVKVLRCVSYHSSKLLCGPVGVHAAVHLCDSMFNGTGRPKQTRQVCTVPMVVTLFTQQMAYVDCVYMTPLVMIRSSVQDHPKYKQAMRARKPEAKLRIILGACQGVSKDEASGAPQPKYR